jgi:hypothetical protein
LKRVSVDPLHEAKRHRTSTDTPPPPSILHKKRSKHYNRDAVKAADSQSSVVRLLSCYNAMIYLQSSQIFSSMAGPEAPNDANHPSMQCDPPVSAIVSSTSRGADPRPRSRVGSIFITTT